MAEYIIDKIEYGGNVYKLQDSVSDFLTGAVTALSTTEGQHSTITNQNGAVSIAIPTKTSHLTNDSGFITSFTDENVKNTAVTAATTYYLTGSTGSSTATSGLSKHAAIKAYVTGNGSTGGSARIDLGNTTATTSAGGKEGIIRLYGTSATYYVELKAGAPSANRTISFPNKTGTVALTTDIPTVSYPVTSVNNKTGAVSLSASDVGALPSTTAIPSKTSDLTNDSGFLTSHQDISGKADKSSTVSNITYDSTSRTLKKTINGTTSDVVDFGTAAFKLFTDSISNTSTNLPTSAAVASFVEGKGYLTSYTETDPVFSASAAAGITSTDISNWNAKVSDDKTWNGVTLNKSVTTVTSDLYIPCTISTSSTAAYLIKALDSSYSGGSIARRTSAGYLVAQTPSANDNSTKVATTAYVNAAIPDVSGFSTTDEKLKINAVSDTNVYYPIFGSNSTSTASTQLYDSNFKYQSATGATLTLGSLNGKMGSWHIFKGGYYINLQPATLTSTRTIYLPDKGGTIALTSDIPTVSYPVTSVNSKTGAVSLTASDVGALASSTTYVSTITTSAGTHSTISSKSGTVSFNVPTKTSHLTNDSGFLTLSTLPIYDGTVQ